MQNIKRRYDRFFIMFKPELNGYSIDGREPNGYCKIEIRDGKGKINTSIQGLKPLKDGSMYRVYLISAQTDKALGIPIGWLDIDSKGRAECKWEFNPDNVDGTGLAIEDFNVSAIILNGDNIRELTIPIVGYKEKEVLWKSQFKDISEDSKKVEHKEPELIHKDSKFKETIEHKDSKLKEIMEHKDLKLKEITEHKDLKSKETIKHEDLKSKEIIKNNEQELIKYKEQNKEIKNDLQPNKEIQQKSIPNVQKEKEIKTKQENISKEENEKKEKESNPHKIFNEMVNKFYSEMEELEKYKILNTDNVKMLDLEVKEMNKEDLDDISYMFKINEKIIPFERANKSVQWIKIAPFELVTLDLLIWTYIKHQFINASYKKYKHLILGRYIQNNSYKYILGIPDLYDEKYVDIAKDLGFKKFICCRGKMYKNGEQGYWIMEL